MLEAINQHKMYYLAVEMYLPTQDDIYSQPEVAMFRMSDSRFFWRTLAYKDKITSIPSLDKFIGKEFNELALELVNVERLINSGSRFVFTQLIRGYRVAVRMIFPGLTDQRIEDTRLIWWGRVAAVESITEKSVKISCSQEIGNFSYEIATQKYGQACPLWFGRGDCLGSETFEQKSPQYQDAFNRFGQGGCNRTNERCVELANERFYQGQKIVTVQGGFIREEVVKQKFLFFFTIKRKTKTPVQWSSKNQSENSDVTIPRVLGRAKVELYPFTWADTGTNIVALLGGCKGLIQGFYNITCLNPKLTVAEVTQHLGEYGGEGSQYPDIRFPASGFNSKLAYLGATFGGSPPADEPEETPTTTAVIKGEILDAPDAMDNFIQRWSNNPVWLTRHILTDWQYTVIKKAWFNEVRNIDTADYCFNVLEDDTDAEQPLVSGADAANYDAGLWTRYASTSRINSDILRAQNDPFATPEDYPADIWWGSSAGDASIGQSRTYLALRFTANGVINESSSLSDVLYSLLLPTFRGFLRFNLYGKVEIDCRKPADNAWVRVNAIAGEGEIGVTNVSKFIERHGYLLIGVGKLEGEIGKPTGVRYVNGSELTGVAVESSGGTTVTTTGSFEERESGPSELFIDFSGTPTVGERIALSFTEPDGTSYTWDYFVAENDTLEVVVQMFKVRLMASPVFRDTWTADVFTGAGTRIVVRCQTGYVKLETPLKFDHFIGEEIIRVVEVYEDAKDEENLDGIRDNMRDFVFNDRKQEIYHGVKGTYISAVQDFRETEIQPRIAWDAAEQERNLNLLELDLRFVDNYRQAAWLTKSATIDFVDGNLYSSWKTGIRAMFHEEGDIVAVRHQTMQGLSYTPFTVESLEFSDSAQQSSLTGKLYLSAAFDDRVAKEEKFYEATLTQGGTAATPEPVVSPGGYSTTGTGDGGGDTRQAKRHELEAYETLPEQQKYSPTGADRL